MIEASKPMRICMVSYSFYEADNRVRRYAEALARRGDHVDAIALRREGLPEFEVIRGVNVHRIQKRSRDERGPLTYLWKLLAFLFRSAFVLTKSSFTKPYDLIHVHSVPDFEVFSTLVPKMMGTKVILDIHDIVPEFYAGKFGVKESSMVFRGLRWMEKLSCWFSNHVIISNHLWLAKLTSRSVPADRCTAVINYPDPTIFSARGKKSNRAGQFLICYPGTLNRHQGVDIAVRAMTILREKAPEINLLVVGDGPERENLKALVRELDLDDRVTLSGPVSIDRIAEIMSSVDLGVVPKRNDSFGNEAFSTKIMEFMAVGVPVLASRTRVDQYYFNEDILEFFDSGSVEDFAAKVIDLYRNPMKRQRLTANASVFARENSWDIKQSNYLSLVDSLVSNRAVKARHVAADR